ncbi:MAG: hypothetical protein ACREOO_06670 [bacterium]
MDQGSDFTQRAILSLVDQATPGTLMVYVNKEMSQRRRRFLDQLGKASILFQSKLKKMPPFISAHTKHDSIRIPPLKEVQGIKLSLRSPGKNKYAIGSFGRLSDIEEIVNSVKNAVS